jgi:hypothetical protein
MQTLHYLTLSVIIPPLLAAFAEPSSLKYEGGAANVGASIFPIVRHRHLNSTSRDDYGLAPNGWPANGDRHAYRREMVGMERRQENWIRVEG